MLSKRAKYFLAAIPMLLLAASAVHAQTTADVYPLFPGEAATGDYRQYITAFYKFSIAAGTLIATILIMIGGMIWVTSAGNPGRIDKAKSYIIDSIIGVILLMSAYTILQVVNPNLVNLKSVTQQLKIPGVNIGACTYLNSGKNYCRVAANVEDCNTPGTTGSVAGYTSGTFFPGKDCAAVCKTQTDGSCKLIGDAANDNKQSSRNPALERAQYCVQFSTSYDAMNARVSDWTRYDARTNCQTYCSSRSQVSGIDITCSGQWEDGRAVGGTYLEGRCNCV